MTLLNFSYVAGSLIILMNGASPVPVTNKYRESADVKLSIVSVPVVLGIRTTSSPTFKC